MYNYTCIFLTGDNKIQLLEIWQGHLEPPVGQQTSKNHYKQQVYSYLALFVTYQFVLCALHTSSNKKLGMRLDYMEQIEESDCCCVNVN